MISNQFMALHRCSERSVDPSRLVLASFGDVDDWKNVSIKIPGKEMPLTISTLESEIPVYLNR